MLAISTAWNFHRHGALIPAIDEIAALGFEAVELRAKGAIPDLLGAGEHCRGTRMKCFSVHAPLTSTPWGEGDPTRGLASPDEEVRRSAVRAALSTLRPAAPAGARVIVLELGEIPLPGFPEKQRQWVRRIQDGENVGEEIGAALDERRRRRDPHLAAAARSLYDLSKAESAITWSISCRQGLWEIPDIEELELLVEDAKGARVGYTHDTSHALTRGRLGLEEPLAWLDRFGAITTGFRFHDQAGGTDHLPPGSGEVDWEGLLPWASPRILRTIQANEHSSPVELRIGADFLRDKGLA